jgi:hypothetical protein
MPYASIYVYQHEIAKGRTMVIRKGEGMKQGETSISYTSSDAFGVVKGYSSEPYL